jgi:2-octaprenyl-6-methoxyphenol hydroxylase
MAKKDDLYDVLVVGGGLAGLSLTCLLAARGVRVLCLDRDDPARQADASFDGRTTAVSFGSRRILEAAGIWDSVADEACAIETIHILDGGSPVLLDFDSAEVEGRAFGWIVGNGDLRAAMMARLKSLKTAHHVAPAPVTDFSRDEKAARAHLADGRVFAAKLIIGADGRDSFTRRWMGIDSRAWSYRQRAIVCVAAHENPHDHIAVEHFHPGGPFAILPMKDDADGAHRSSVVWTEHGADRDSALHYDQDSFDAALTARFPARYGAVRQVGGRFAFPLGFIHAHSYIGPRMALAAEAAHGIHPIAGQGLNLGFRDIAALVDLIVPAVKTGRDPGGDEILEKYQRARRLDNMAMAGATDILNRLFSNDIAPVGLARRAGLRLVARMPKARRFFMIQAMGAAGLLPALMADSKTGVRRRKAA